MLFFVRYLFRNGGSTFFPIFRSTYIVFNSCNLNCRCAVPTFLCQVGIFCLKIGICVARKKGFTNYVVSAALRDEYNIVKYKKSAAGSNLFLFTIKIRQCIFAEIPVTFRKNIQFSNLIKVPRTVLQILSN